ncbi:hypothetical protein F01_200033 [Burkholderia cenocepacia]|nr:hypothetical protein F01_200033 [Burkholderia cenocepacia]
MRTAAFFDDGTKYLRGPFVYQGGKPEMGRAPPAAFASDLPFPLDCLPSLYRRCR